MGKFEAMLEEKKAAEVAARVAAEEEAARKIAAQIAATKIQRTKKAQELRRAEAELARIEAARLAEIARLAGLADHPQLAELQEAALKTEEARRNAMSEENRQKDDDRRKAMTKEARNAEDANRLVAEAKKLDIKIPDDAPIHKINKEAKKNENKENKHFNWMGGVVITALGVATLGGILIARRSNQDKDDELDSDCSDYSDDENSCGIAEDDLEAGMTDCEAEDGEIAEISIKQGAGRGDKFKYEDDDCATLSPRSNGRARTNSTASSCVSAGSATFAKKHRATSPTSTMDDLLLPY